VTLAYIHHLLLIPLRFTKFTTPILPNLSRKNNFFEHHLPDFAVQKLALNYLYVPQHTCPTTCAAAKHAHFCHCQRSAAEELALSEAEGRVEGEKSGHRIELTSSVQLLNRSTVKP
jgi:hypothetical protein